MHSLRTKITAMTVIMIIVVMVVSTFFGVLAIRYVGTQSAKKMLLLLCETGEKNLDHYFESVEQSVDMVSAYVESDLDGVDDKKLQAHLDRVDDMFKKLTYRTNGVLTYYYRIDPEVSTKAKGFWYVNLDGDGFVEHEVTDITKYDTTDTSRLVWFTVPKYTGEGVWLAPYITDNLDVRVISYNVPVYYKHQFIGVIGIEIDYSTMARQVDNITLYDSGYAFINDKDGNIIYHPRLDVTQMEVAPKVPEGMLSEGKYISYKYDGVEKMGVWLPLENGMRLNVSVPVSEINEAWVNWTVKIIIIFAVLLALFVVLIMTFAGHITKPLRDLTKAAEEIDAGKYDCELSYNGKDEVGILTRTFNRLTKHLKSYITELNDLAYADSLTSVHNRGAFDIAVSKIQQQLEESAGAMEFAICMFDCNKLKTVNDENGHDKGDIYLKETAAVICEVFEHCPVFRIGGDEFAVIIQGASYSKKDSLLELFDEKCAYKRIQEVEAWEEIDVARGMAVYDPSEDKSVGDVIRRADKLMYENKWQYELTREEDQK